MQTQPYYRRKLLDELATRQRRNSNYSLRAFAKFLGLQPPTLSAVLSGKRNLPAKQAAPISERLGLAPIEKRKFVTSVKTSKLGVDENSSSLNDRVNAHILDEERHYRVIAEWEHYAILSLMDTELFSADPMWIADRLGISVPRVSACLENLKCSQLIQVGSNGELKKTHKNIQTTDGISSLALRRSHRDELDLARVKLEEIALELRDYSSMTIALNREDLAEAKKFLKTWRRKFAALVEKSAKKNEVYQLCIQLFPLTRGNDRA